MALRLARRLAGTLLAVAAVMVGTACLTWLLFYAMRPTLFPPEPGAAEQLREFVERAFLHLDFGRSRSDREVSRLMREGLPVDAALYAGGLVAGIVIGVAAGLACAVRPRGVVRRSVELVAAAAVSTPVYVVGLCLLLFFGDRIASWVDLGVPLQYDGIHTLLVPWVVLGLPLAGLLVRSLARSAEEVRAQEYLRASAARGLSPRRILLRHVLPPALAPALAQAGASANLMLLNMVLVESVFSVPGFLQEVRRSVGAADVPVLLALTVVSAGFVVATSMLLGAVADAIDPRTRHR